MVKFYMIQRRPVIFAALLLIATSVSAFSLGEWRSSLYNNVKQQAEQGFSDLTKRKVTIGSAGGIIVGQIVLNRVNLPGLGTVKKIILEYNLVKFALSKGDINSSLTKMIISDGELNIQRNIKGNWNFRSLVTPPQSGGPPGPAFRVKIEINHCHALYVDHRGFGAKPKEFRADINSLSGLIDLGNADQIKLSASGLLPEKFKVSGTFDLKKGKYEVDIEAAKLPVKKWADYALSFPDFIVNSGTADLQLKIASPKTAGWPIAIKGKASLTKADFAFQLYKFNNLSGDILFEDRGLTFNTVKGSIGQSPFTLNGQLTDFKQLLLDLSLSIPEIDLKNLVSLRPDLASLNLAGKGSAVAAVKGTLPSPQIEGRVNLDGALQNQKLKGEMSFVFKDRLLLLTSQSLALYRGSAGVDLRIDFSKKNPPLELAARFNSLQLAALAQEAPGVEGSASGSLSIKGSINGFSGKISADLANARILGQPTNNLTAFFGLYEGEFNLENLQLSSPSSSISAKGRIERDLTFNLITEARGLRLAGKGIFGKMAVTVDQFKGSTRWKLNPQFLSSPLKNLTAAGDVTLSEGAIGEQRIDQAQGHISIGGGKIEITDTSLQIGKAQLYVSGQTGIGVPTDLKISGQNLNLANLKLINAFLPAGLQNPTGSATLEINVTGNLPKDTHLTSIDPLLDLSAKGYLSLNTARFDSTDIKNAHLGFEWKDRALTLSDGILELAGSLLKISLKSDRGGVATAEVEGTINLGQLTFLTKGFGRVDGLLGINLQASGTAENYSINSSFWINDFRFNDIHFDSISSSFSLQNQQLSLVKPLTLQQKDNLYALSGGLHLNPDDFAGSVANLKLNIINARAGNLFTLVEQIRQEVLRRLPAASSGGKVFLSRLSLPNPKKYLRPDSSILLYSANGVKTYFIKDWQKQSPPSSETTAVDFSQQMGGTVNGTAEISGPLSNPSGNLYLRISDGNFVGFKYDELKLSAGIINRQIKIGETVLRKGNGTLNLAGDLTLPDKIFVQLTANNFPTEILSIVFPGKDFHGVFNLNAAIDGNLADPRISFSVAANRFGIDDIYFDRTMFSLTKKGSRIYLHEFSLLEGQSLSSAYGEIDFSPGGTLSLEASLKGNAPVLINLFTNDVRWLSGNSLITLKASGTLDQPRLNGNLSLTDGAIRINALNSEIRNLQGNGKLENNQLTITALTGIWVGGKKAESLNPVSVTGSIDFSNALAKNPALNFNLAASPARLYVNLRDLYNGNLTIDNLTLTGPLAFDMSQGPLLSGKVSLDNSTITIPQASAPPPASLVPLNFNLEADLNQNVYAEMGDIATLNLSNIFLDLEISGQAINVRGSIKSPLLLGKIYVKRGTVNIFNREFSLLSPETQKQYYPYSTDKIHDNFALFSGEQGAYGILPNLDVTTAVNVYSMEKDSNTGQYVKKDIIILARLTGIPGSLDKERGLNVFLSGFSEDKTKNPPQINPENYSEADLRVMLLPDFIKSLAGIGEGAGGTSQVTANAVMADYLNSRVQTLLFRSLEREAEQTLGLESLTLEYNFGPQIREAMGIRDTSGMTENQPAFAVGFVKGFFNRLYINVRYSEGPAGTTTSTGNSNTTNFNYQLTYKITPIWSIIYYREPISLAEITTGSQKVTLQAGFSFW